MDWLYDLELDTTALVISLVIAAITAFFFFTDPVGVGFDKLPLAYRIIGILAGTVVGYFVAVKKLE